MASRSTVSASDVYKRQVHENLEKYGCSTWYDWCIENWGTKWNSCNCEFDEENSIIRFNTAWDSPFPIAHKISEMFPELRFVWTYADESIGSNAGRGYGKDKSFHILIEEDMSILYEYYLYCWGKCKCIYKDEAGKYQQYSCAECPQECILKSMEIA